MRGKNAGDVSSRFVFLTAEFGVGVNVAANFEETGLKLGSNLLDGGEHEYLEKIENPVRSLASCVDKSRIKPGELQADASELF